MTSPAQTPEKPQRVAPEDAQELLDLLGADAEGDSLDDLDGMQA